MERTEVQIRVQDMAGINIPVDKTVVAIEVEWAELQVLITDLVAISFPANKTVVVVAAAG